MIHGQRPGALVRVVAVLLAGAVPIAGMPVAAAQAPVPQPGESWSLVRITPPGVRLRLFMKDSLEVTGTVVDTAAEAITLEKINVERGTLRSQSDRAGTVFERGSVSAVQHLTNTYKAAGPATDTNMVRYVVNVLGTGSEINLKTGARGMRGTIDSIQEDGFTVKPGGHPTSQRLAFGEVTEVSPARSRGKKIAIIAGIAGGTFLALMLIGFTLTR